MNIFWITERIAQGAHPFFIESYQQLHVADITHVLDLSDIKRPVNKSIKEQLQIIHEDIADFRLIPINQMLLCIKTIHEILMQPENKIYIHCYAGHGRSPTILWLYLIACGMDADVAKQLIKDKNPHANPGGENLINESHIPAAESYGKNNGFAIVHSSLSAKN